MIVVADTAPLNYLIQIGWASLLRELYVRVIIPPAVLAELENAAAPPLVRQWILHVPEWIEVKRPFSPPDVGLSALDPGEQEAIQLAQEQHAELLLIDERKGRLEAMRRGLATTGTLGILLAAAERGSIDAVAVYQRLTNETNFRSSPELERSFLAQVREITDEAH